MAVSYTWPLSLPQLPDTNYTETGGVNIIRTATDAGPAKQRKRGNKPQVLQLTFTMSNTQVPIFENFVKNTLQGVARFGYTHPRLLTVVEARIIPQSQGDLYTISYISPVRYSVQLSMEILP
jgi:hypothetical protein